LKNDYQVETVDLEWFGNCVNPKNIKKDFRALDASMFGDVVILLAGHSSVAMCVENCESALRNNVNNFVSLAQKLTKQKFIYASSSSVYSGTMNATEDENYFYQPGNCYDLSKYLIDLFVKSTKLDWYGLRFGTVNGNSENLRSDLMINKMVMSARENKKIHVISPELSRPILGMHDLCRAVKRIINSESKPGIYNICSFNSTVMEIAKGISEIMDVPVEVGHGESSYNFSISNEKFVKEFNFTFVDNLKSIADSLISDNKLCAPRSEKIIYV
jgi:nucleoside-diphosphate-sugar epimerase